MDTARRTVTVSCPFCGTGNRIDMARAADRPLCGQCRKPILLDRPVRITDADFDRVISTAEVPVLVDFYADWCGPCKIMAPILDDIARARVGTVLIGKLDTDRNQATSARFGIRGIPTLIVFRNGAEHLREVGAVPRQRIEALLTA
jgi:thioredoxin 2